MDETRASGDMKQVGETGSSPTDGEVFVLELAENPHPAMLDLALRARRLAKLSPGEPVLYRYWQGVLDAMCAATGESPEDMNAWLDRHDDVDLSKLASKGQPVEIVRKP